MPWGYLVDYDSQSSTYKHYVPYEPHARLVTEHNFQVFAALPFPSVVEVARHWGRNGLVWPFFGPEVDPRRVRVVEAACTRNETLGGYEFHFQQAHNILTDVSYLGWRARAGHIAWDEECQAPRICHTPLVDEDLFWWCYDHLLTERPAWAPPRQTQFVQTFRPRPSRRRRPELFSFLVPGRVRCAQHGNILGVMLYPGDKPFLRCHGNDRLRLASSACSAVLATSVEQAVCETFMEQLTLDEDDLRNLANLAARRGMSHEDEAASLQRELTEQRQRYTRAKRLGTWMLAMRRSQTIFSQRRAGAADHGRVSEQLTQPHCIERANPSPRHWAKSGMDGHDGRAHPVHLSQSGRGRCASSECSPLHCMRIPRRIGLTAEPGAAVTLGRWRRAQRREMVSRVGLLTAWSEDEEQALRAYFHRLTWDALQRMIPAPDQRRDQTGSVALGLEATTTLTV